MEQGLVKGEKFCFRNLDFYFLHVLLQPITSIFGLCFVAVCLIKSNCELLLFHIFFFDITFMIYCHKVKTMRSSVTKIGLEYLNQKNHENIQNSFKIWLEPFHITSFSSKLYTLLNLQSYLEDPIIYSPKRMWSKGAFY